MKFRADEITSVIQREIEQFRSEVTKTEVGRVLEVGDGIARIHGLSGVMTGEMLSFENGVRGLAFNLEESSERIKTTLQRLKLDTAVALDKDGRVAERYGATAIPQTVIIDREGKVARLFVGGGARFDEQLRQALKSVLDRPVLSPAD